MRKFSSYLVIGLKGICMGAADVIPGVSGGTIAFLTGIYSELINSIKSVDLSALKLLFTGKIKQFWIKINGTFLISLVLGILISFFSLAKLMTYLMEYHPIPLWSFFFGLIISSAVIILKDIKGWRFIDFVALIIGVAIGVSICLLSPSETTNSLWFIFLCGAIAICAMILPGISGSFILLILGKYQYMLGAIADVNIAPIIVFACGALIGIISFSHFLSWLLKKFYTFTICLLAGIMVGSLLKVWPWQNILENGVSRPSAPSGHILEAIIFVIVGFIIVMGIEFFARRMKKENN
jgi:putative membrane protein